MRFLVRIHGACPNNAICVFPVRVFFFLKGFTVIFPQEKKFFRFFFLKGFTYFFHVRQNILRDFFTTEFIHVLGIKNIYIFSSNISCDKKFTTRNIIEKKMFFVSKFILSPKSDRSCSKSIAFSVSPFRRKGGVTDGKQFFSKP